MSTRKKMRVENKKRKLAAFLEIAQENDKTRQEKVKGIENIRNEEISSDSSADDEQADNIASIDSTTEVKKPKLETVTEEELQKQPMNDDEFKALRAKLKERPRKDEQPIDDSSIEIKKARIEPDSVTKERLKDQKNDDELKALRIKLKARQKASMQRPKIYLTPAEMRPIFGGIPAEVDIPLYVGDIQHLVTETVIAEYSSYKPRWCKLLRPNKVKHTAVICVSGLSMDDYKKHEECFKKTNSLFSMKSEVLNPSLYGNTVTEEMFMFPKSNRLLAKQNLKKFKYTGNDVKSADTPGAMKQCLAEGDAFPRTSLLLSHVEMAEENIPLPTDANKVRMYKYTNEKYEPCVDTSPLFGIDCEMCRTKAGQEVTRVSVVNEKLETVYDTLVKPFNRIIDYVTRYSGITKKMLDPVTIRLSDVQRKIQEILPADAILCGQSISSDLHAIKMFHPYIIDTSVIYNLSGFRRRKTGLKRLAGHFLGRDIQGNSDGHNSIEDSSATLQLVLLKLKHDPTFGDVIQGGNIAPLKTISEEEPSYKTLKPDDDNNEGNASEECDTSDPNDSDTNLSEAQTKELMEKQVNFFKTFKSRPRCNLFDIIGKQNKTALLIDEPNSTVAFMQDNCTIVECQTDKTRVQSFLEKHPNFNLSWLNLHNCERETKTEDERQSLFKKVDKRINQVHKVIPECTALIVVFAGRAVDDTLLNGGVLVKVT
ncbi:unnamed protein product [Owenia fusiformis]|uniref:Uncharacterized protein n=1 Tax=Owenia fusiformis TaxID=6347 RepID=A0A8J1U7Q1_OWEFU|nr:unnamed protein product [Owenia fusiformis]